MNRKLVPIFVLLILALVVAACGEEGKDEPAAPEPTSTPKVEATKEPTSTPEPKELTPQELGEEIGATYLESIQKATELVKDRPSVDEVKAKVAELKETYVQRLVALGRQRETLGREDRAVVDYAIQQILIGGSKTDWYNTYFEAVQYYFDQDYDFQQLLYGFNIIGQYANFDLLKKQTPEEAVRLGIMDADELPAAPIAAPTPTAGPTGESGGLERR